MWSSHCNNFYIKDVNLQKLQPRGCLSENTYIPLELNDCIETAVRERNFPELLKIFNIAKTLPRVVSLEAVKDRIYYRAIAHDYNSEQFKELLKTFPIDPNRKLHFRHQMGCLPPRDMETSLLGIADIYSRDALKQLLGSPSVKSVEKQFEGMRLRS